MADSLSKLAEGKQLRGATVPLSRPDITDFERKAVLEVLDSPWLSLGPKLGEFEKALADHVGAQHAIAVNSGTSALHLAVKAAGIKDGDEVITTPFSFVASANCIQFERGKPVFVDIDPQTLNIDPSRLEAAITQRTRAILPVHIFGRPCDIVKIGEVSARHGLVLIEDACEAIGATVGGRFVGTFGQTGTFAFYPNKQITTGEGGAILTSDDQVARACRRWRNQGRGDSGAWLQHETLGYNYRLSDINCALGIAQLKRLDGILQRRTRVAELYTDLLSRNVPAIHLPPESEGETTVSWFVYVVRLADDFTQVDRDGIIRYLRTAGIECNNYFTPIHLQPFYREAFGYAHGDFPVTERISERTIALPFFTTLSENEIRFVCRTLQEAIGAIGTPRCY